MQVSVGLLSRLPLTIIGVGVSITARRTEEFNVQIIYQVEHEHDAMTDSTGCNIRVRRPDSSRLQQALIRPDKSLYVLLEINICYRNS